MVVKPRERTIAVDEAQQSELETKEKPLSFKEMLFSAMGAGPAAKELTEQEQPAKDENMLSLPAQATAAAAAGRARNDSLRDGGTSKVIENLDIEAPKMDKEQIEEYLRFKALKNSQLTVNAVGVANMAPRDRKLS